MGRRFKRNRGRQGKLFAHLRNAKTAFMPNRQRKDRIWLWWKHKSFFMSCQICIGIRQRRCQKLAKGFFVVTAFLILSAGWTRQCKMNRFGQLVYRFLIKIMREIKKLQKLQNPIDYATFHMVTLCFIARIWNS